MIQDLSGSWYIKGTGESITRVDLPVSLMHHDPDRSWITDPDPDHPKGTLNFKVFLLPNSCVICHQIFSTYIAKKILKLSFILNCVLKRENDLKTISN